MAPQDLEAPGVERLRQEETPRGLPVVEPEIAIHEVDPPVARDGWYFHDRSELSPEEFERVRDSLLLDERDKEEFAQREVDWPEEITFSSVLKDFGVRVESQDCLDELEFLGMEANVRILEVARQLAEVKADAHQKAWDANDIYATAEKAKENNVSYAGTAPGTNVYLISLRGNAEYHRLKRKLQGLRSSRRHRAVEIVRSYRSRD